PHIRPDSESNELVGNIDIAPTVLELAGAEADKSIDGRSLTPFLHDPELKTLRPYLFESFVETDDVDEAGAIAEPSDQSGASERKRGKPVPELQQPRQRPGASASLLAPPKDYEGIRLGPWKYIAWPD